ncbi:Thioredoxin domain-containing protein 11 [Chionoecetes opilio]|uniref:Thioredoxin domain-containing protein 11 n=1 Tax=Chionoecetes opilio TaxID=41210 RepID=A0A8J5D1D4_CHIOP|nr:Thioredoxin domain-containing protein 11 [Chionoecetes opilio]
MKPQGLDMSSKKPGTSDIESQQNVLYGLSCLVRRMQPLESTVTLAIGRQVYAACGLLRSLDDGFDSCSLVRLELGTFCSPTRLLKELPPAGFELGTLSSALQDANHLATASPNRLPQVNGGAALHSNCVACSSVGHVFLAAAHTLRRLHDVTFARINTAGNTLPWQPPLHRLPSIIVHPPLRKSESRVFDLSHPITPASVLSFIMADLGPRQRITLALQACGEPCREGVLHEAALTSTTLHHNITLSTSRLQRLLDRLVKAGPATHTAADFSLREQRQYERLWHARSRLVKDIKTQRKKLEHLNHMQKLLSKPSIKRLLTVCEWNPSIT